MQLEPIRWLALAVLILFTGYTAYCVRKEHFWKACRRVWTNHWGRQVTVDLYIGLSVFGFFIYLNEQSVGKTILWLLPTYALGNIVPLLYLVLFFDQIVKHFS